MTVASLSETEIQYFCSLPPKKQKIVLICFQNLFQNLELDSSDSKNTLSQIHANLKKWDDSEEGQSAWAPLLDSLRLYLQSGKPPPASLLNRVTALQSCIPQ